MMKRRLPAGNRLARRIPVTPFGDVNFTLQLVSSCKGDPFSMGSLRRLLLESGRRIDVHHFTDDQVIAEIARLVWTGEIEIGTDSIDEGGGSSEPKAGTQPAAAPTGTPVRSGPPAPEPESPTFSPNLNGATQAATLSAAAASGAPFCPH